MARRKQTADEHRVHIWLVPSMRPLRYAESSAAANGHIPPHLAIVDGIAEDIRQGHATPVRLQPRDTPTLPSRRTHAANRAIGIGLATSDSRAVSQVTDMNSLAQMVGSIGYRAIDEALQATSMSRADDWLGVMWGYHENIWGRAGTTGRLIVPGLGSGSGPIVTPIDYSTVEPWEEQFRGYRFEAFGRIVRSQADVDQSPTEAHWARSIDGPSELGGIGQYGMVVYRTRVFHPASPIYGIASWRPGWPNVAYSYGGTSTNLDDDNSIARSGLKLYRGIIANAGRPKVGRETRIDRLAEAGLKWLDSHPYHAVEDVGRGKIAEAMGDDTPRRRVNKLMERQPKIMNADVHRRMHELIKARRS
jgi:hypothetical protein